MLILLFIGYLLSICVSLYYYWQREKLSIRIAENYINENINKYIIQAQLNYSGYDNIKLITEWIKAIDRNKLSDFENKLFDDFLENSKDENINKKEKEVPSLHTSKV